jgi:hypothetical protein
MSEQEEQELAARSLKIFFNFHIIRLHLVFEVDEHPSESAQSSFKKLRKEFLFRDLLPE